MPSSELLAIETGDAQKNVLLGKLQESIEAVRLRVCKHFLAGKPFLCESWGGNLEKWMGLPGPATFVQSVSLHYYEPTTARLETIASVGRHGTVNDKRVVLSQSLSTADEGDLVTTLDEGWRADIEQLLGDALQECPTDISTASPDATLSHMLLRHSRRD